MRIYNPKQFTRPDVLKKMRPELLLEFLEPYRVSISESGVELPSSTADGEIDYTALAEVFASIDPASEWELAEPLCLLDDVVRNASIDTLLDYARRRSVPLDPNPDVTKADLAVTMWLCDREELHRLHTELSIAGSTVRQEIQRRKHR